MNERKEERKEGMRKVQRKYVKREGMEARLAGDRKGGKIREGMKVCM